MKIVLIVVCGLVLAGGAVKFLASGSTPVQAGAAPQATTAVKRGELKISVSESGYLKAKNSVNIQPQFAREGTITSLVKEGKSVEADEVLVEFDKTEVQTQLDDLSNTLIQYRTEQEASKAEFEIQKRESMASSEKAEFELQVARMKLEMYEKGEGPNEMRKKKLASEKAHSELDRARERFDKVPELRKEGFLTKIQEEEERIAVREKEIGVENADKDFELYQTYTQPMELRQRQNAVQDAERGLTNAREKAEISLKEKEARVTSSEGKVKSTDARLAKLERELGYMTIRAPRAGIVYYGNPAEPWNHDDIKVGNRIHQGNTVITLPDLKEMQVLIQVHEADIDLVKIDQTALVTLEAVKDRTFQGKVTKIGAVANSNWGNPENKTFEVEITMDPIEVELRAGTTAKAEIQVETVPDTLQIPVHAVFAEEEDHFCFVSGGASYEKRSVKIGKNNNHHVEVLAGLKEGEPVLLYDPRDVGLPDEGKAGGPAAPASEGATAAPGMSPSPAVHG
jgi:HlyD family secretion protein